MDRRPPLAVSPRRLRPRPHRAQRPPLVPSSTVKTPPGSIKKATSMRASTCSIPSPLRHHPSPIRASISALPSPLRFDTTSPMRASVSALPSAARLDLSPPRAKLDLPASAPSPASAARAAGKENIPAALSSPSPARASGKKESQFGADRDERVARDLAALAKAASPVAGPLFVRGRLYDLYSARRDERLKRKHGFPYGAEWAPAADAEAMAEDPCVAVELSRRRVAKKASTTAVGAESVRRSMPAGDFAAARGGGLGMRSSSLRSSKEMKKASAASGAVSVAVKERRINPRSSARRI